MARKEEKFEKVVDDDKDLFVPIFFALLLAVACSSILSVSVSPHIYFTAGLFCGFGVVIAVVLFSLYMSNREVYWRKIK